MPTPEENMQSYAPFAEEVFGNKNPQIRGRLGIEALGSSTDANQATYLVSPQDPMIWFYAAALLRMCCAEAGSFVGRSL